MAFFCRSRKAIKYKNRKKKEKSRLTRSDYCSRRKDEAAGRSPEVTEILVLQVFPASQVKLVQVQGTELDEPVKRWKKEEEKGTRRERSVRWKCQGSQIRAVAPVKYPSSPRKGR